MIARWPILLVALSLIPEAAARPREPVQPPDAVLTEANELLAAAKIAHDWDVTEESARRAAAAGLSEERLVRLVRKLAGECLAEARACRAFDVLAPRETKATRAARILVALLGHLGTRASFPLLYQLDGRGMYQAESARERILARAMAAAPRPCLPPTPEEVKAARLTLGDFVALVRRGARVEAVRPGEGELDDLAYFLAASAGAGPEVGRSREQGQGAHHKPGPARPERERLVRALEAAKLEGRIDEVARLARLLLGSLGYPGPIRTEEEHEYAWGGPRYAYVMRDLAAATESLGSLAEAARLYRRADPGGGACGTSVSVRWADQLRGVIRSEELVRGCRAVVPERLLEIDESGPSAYGTARLARAGFDLPRLYRGALVTLNRDLEPAELRRVLERIPAAPLRQLALARLDRLGVEDWARRVHALEGLADTAQRQALPLLLATLDRAAAPARIRALEALGKLAARPEYDPCDPNVFAGMSSSSQWSRRIRPVGRVCKTQLSPAESRDLVRKIVPHVADADPEVREAGAAALGAIGSPAAQEALRKLASDPHGPTGQTCRRPPGAKTEACRPLYPVREAAAEALRRIDELEAKQKR